MNSEGMEGLEGLSFSQHELEVLRQAKAVEELMRMPIFDQLVTTCDQQYLGELMASGDNDTELRERCFWKQKGLRGLLDLAQQVIQDSQEILRKKRKEGEIILPSDINQEGDQYFD